MDFLFFVVHAHTLTHFGNERLEFHQAIARQTHGSFLRIVSGVTINEKCAVQFKAIFHGSVTSSDWHDVPQKNFNYDVQVEPLHPTIPRIPIIRTLQMEHNVIQIRY
ncbi:Uncharacterised protein [Achromobacter xylosoxidans]|nr:Uncharacterised protein [Achromobacter xylosoxidans]